ncbi:putative poly-beta-hydroxyalkanoate synthase [Microcystis aeruginosa NIES-3787]|uniref:Putative poly-beta-hydroxyalkanoate synthase n=1 Tax=Microcystis aeruginosa NIES-3787 TaxID=2517782 RepID=A0A6H9FVY4_MICAE|nr:putative poly-beta-hydroxyalkanoate synthase [Microcystis aeruginosa NIES-3787]
MDQRFVSLPASESSAYPESNELFDKPTSADRMYHAALARFTGSVSPGSAALAWMDWWLHLSASPGKQQLLLQKAAQNTFRLLVAASKPSSGGEDPHCIEPLSRDRRFRAPQWQHWPFCLIYQSFLMQQQWWHNATTGIGGMSDHHQQLTSFASRQLLDIVSPANFIATNPEVIEATWREAGRNLWRGWQFLLEDLGQALDGSAPGGSEHFRLGVDVAVTPGQVVFRNHLMELIQYAPQTQQVYCRPLLIVPAWIMKYYILDLSPNNSLVRYLVSQGHTVYMISWRNPDAEDRDLGMDDYLRNGALAALDQVRQRETNQQVNAVGYCLGGTLLAILATWLAQQDRDDLASITLLAAQTDFTESGELRLFIDDSQLDFLDDMMWSQGYLDNRQMAGVFQLLRSRDLIWSRVVNHYLLGQRTPITDLMVWNADATRMPYRMQSEYLRKLFLGNDLFEGRYRVDGRPLALSDVRVPSFVVATESDHVAPWRSVYKLNLSISADMTFLLTSGGHNAGICSEPGHPGRHFRWSLLPSSGNYIDPDHWRQRTPEQAGSWWPCWAEWLARGQTQRASIPVSCGDIGLPAAPGEYVLRRND